MEGKAIQQAKRKIQKRMDEKGDDAKLMAIGTMWAPFLALGDPILTIIWGVAMGANQYLGYLSDKKALEFLEFIKEGQFTEEDLQTDGFREGLRRTFDSFMKERHLEKQEAIKRIFMGYYNTEDRQRFRFERMLRAIDGLELDDFIALQRIVDMVIKPQMKMREREYEKKKAEDPKYDKSLEQYLKEQRVKGFGFKQDGKNEIVNGLLEGFSNLEREGIILTIRSQGNLGSQNSTYKLTPFGHDFCDLILE